LQITKTITLDIAEKILVLKQTVPGHVRIAAVSKTQPVEVILAAYNTGHRLFAENKVQELVHKQAQLPSDIEWHFIGHLQTNKVKYIAPFVGTIQSVDSLRLLLEIDREARRNNRVIDCLLQFHIASEETKFGLNFEEAVTILESDAYRHMINIRLTGVMGMASFSDDTNLITSEFEIQIISTNVPWACRATINWRLPPAVPSSE
jgi:pyridoxal phosphate enzyme (YggS family)